MHGSNSSRCSSARSRSLGRGRRPRTVPASATHGPVAHEVLPQPGGRVARGGPALRGDPGRGDRFQQPVAGVSLQLDERGGHPGSRPRAAVPAPRRARPRSETSAHGHVTPSHHIAAPAHPPIVPHSSARDSRPVTCSVPRRRCQRLPSGRMTPMADVAPFSPDTSAAIARARQHSVGDLLRRTALRYPDKLAVVAGGPPVQLRRVRRGGEPDGERAGRPRPGQGRSARAAGPQLLAVRGARVRHREAGRGAGAGQLHAGRRGDRVHPAALRRRRDGRRGRARPTPRRRRSPRPGWPAGCAAGSATDPADGLGERRRLVDRRAGARPGGRDRRRRSAAADVHLGHRVPAQGRDAVEPLTDRAVRQLRDRRRDGRRRHRGALAADVPLRAAGLLLLRRRLPRARPASSCPARSRPRCWRRSSASGPPSCSARRRCGSPCCATPTSTPATSRRCARATTARRRCRWRCCASCSGGCRTSSSGTSTGRPRWPRWPRSCARTSSCRTPAPRAVRRSTWRPGWSTTTTSRCRRA